MRYADRHHAGRELASALLDAHGAFDDRSIVVGIARGGVPVGSEVAQVIGAALDVAVARKIGAPGNPEYAIGAIAESGTPILGQAAIEAHGITTAYVANAVKRAENELHRRSKVYRGNRPRIVWRDKTVVVVDDGVATGLTLRAVLRTVAAAGATTVICAVPVGHPESVNRLAMDADLVVCPLQPVAFRAVGSWYDDFGQLADHDVMALFESARHTSPSATAAPSSLSDDGT